MGYTKRKITIRQRIKCLFGKHVLVNLFEHTPDRKDRRYKRCVCCLVVVDAVVVCNHEFVTHYQLGQQVIMKCRHCPKLKGVLSE